jgi:hypothetical protein
VGAKDSNDKGSELMKEYVDLCVGCPPEMGCLGVGCPQRNVPVYRCDKCGREEELYEYDGRELCIDCIKELLDKVS